MSTESADWLGPAGLLVLACTGALASVALLRRPCRRLFGAENAFLLWGLPPLAMLASQLPHPAAAGPGVLSGAAWVVISASDALPRVQGGGFDWCGALGWAWLLGVAASLVRAGAARGCGVRWRSRMRRFDGRCCVRRTWKRVLRWWVRGVRGSWCRPISRFATRMTSRP